MGPRAGRADGVVVRFGLALVIGLAVVVGLPGVSSVGATTNAPPAVSNVTSVKPALFGDPMVVKWSGPTTGTTDRLVSVRVGPDGDWSDPVSLGVAYNAASASVACPSADPNVGCSFRIYATNAYGMSAQGASGDGVWLAAAPGDLNVAGGPAANKATITWTTPVATGGLPVVRYALQLSTDGGTTWGSSSSVYTSPYTASCSLLTGCTARMATVTSAGQGPWTAPVGVVYGPVGAVDVSTVAAAPVAGPFVVTWKAPFGGRNPDSFSYTSKVGDDGDWSALTPITGSVGTDRSAPLDCIDGDPDQACTFRVFGVNSAGTSPQGVEKAGRYLPG